MAGEVRDTRHMSEVDRRKIAERDGKIKVLSLKVQMLADEPQKIAVLQAQVTAPNVELTAKRVAASRSTKALEAMTRDQVPL